MATEFTAAEWAETLRSMKDKVPFGDDDLRSMTLGAIRSLANERSDKTYEDGNATLAAIRAALDGLDMAINE
jgi:hypothetical protein